MQIEHTLDIAAPLERLWELTLGLEDWPSFTPTVTSAERLDSGPLRVGSRVRLKQPGQSARVWTVTVLDAPRRFAWSARLLGSTMTGIHELEATEGGSRNLLRVELVGWSSALLAPLLRGAIAKAIAQENAGIKHAAEAAG